MTIYCGDIGDNPRRIEFEPFPDDIPIEEPTPIPTPERELEPA